VGGVAEDALCLYVPSTRAILGTGIAGRPEENLSNRSTFGHETIEMARLEDVGRSLMAVAVKQSAYEIDPHVVLG
jgi:hypothetical protein